MNRERCVGGGRPHLLARGGVAQHALTSLEGSLWSVVPPPKASLRAAIKPAGAPIRSRSLRTTRHGPGMDNTRLPLARHLLLRRAGPEAWDGCGYSVGTIEGRVSGVGCDSHLQYAWSVYVAVGYNNSATSLEVGLMGPVGGQLAPGCGPHRQFAPASVDSHLLLQRKRPRGLRRSAQRSGYVLGDRDGRSRDAGFHGPLEWHGFNWSCAGSHEHNSGVQRQRPGACRDIAAGRGRLDYEKVCPQTRIGACEG